MHSCTINSLKNLRLFKYTKLDEYKLQFIPNIEKSDYSISINTKNEIIITYKFRKIGLFKLFIFYNKMPISESPYLIEGIYGEVDYDKTTIKPKFEKEYYKEKNYNFEIHLHDKNNSRVINNNNNLKCYITGTQTNNIDIRLNKDKLIYEFVLKLYEVGEYDIYILNNENESILNSPVHVKCVDPCDNYAYYKTSSTTVYIYIIDLFIDFLFLSLLLFILFYL